MPEFDYAAWAQQYKDQATIINKRIEKLKKEYYSARTVEQRYSLSKKIAAFEEIHYDLITSYNRLKERSENLHKGE